MPGEAVPPPTMKEGCRFPVIRFLEADRSIVSSFSRICTAKPTRSKPPGVTDTMCAFAAACPPIWSISWSRCAASVQTGIKPALMQP